MNRSLVVLLATATLVAIGLVLWLGNERSSETPAGGAVVPGLAEQVNTLAAIDVIAPGGATAVQLRRDESRWRVLERDGYEADFQQVVDLLRALAEAERVEPRTSNPDWYGRLGVADVGEPDASGRRLEFPGTDLPALIVGRIDPTGAGSYVRGADDPQAWLADRALEIAIDPVAWVEPGIMDIAAEDLVAVTVVHPDGERLRLQSLGESGDWVLRDVPEGRTAGPEWRRNALANGLRGLSLDDVRRFESPGPEGAVRTELVTADGLRFTALSWREGDGEDAAAWVHFRVSEAESTSADDAVETDPAASAEAAERLASAVAVDARLSPWAFRVPARRADDLAPRLEDLLEPLDASD